MDLLLVSLLVTVLTVAQCNAEDLIERINGKDGWNECTTKSNGCKEACQRQDDTYVSCAWTMIGEVTKVHCKCALGTVIQSTSGTKRDYPPRGPAYVDGPLEETTYEFLEGNHALPYLEDYYNVLETDSWPRRKTGNDPMAVARDEFRAEKDEAALDKMLAKDESQLEKDGDQLWNEKEKSSEPSIKTQKQSYFSNPNPYWPNSRRRPWYYDGNPNGYW